MAVIIAILLVILIVVILYVALSLPPYHRTADPCLDYGICERPYYPQPYGPYDYPVQLYRQEAQPYNRVYRQERRGNQDRPYHQNQQDHHGQQNMRKIDRSGIASGSFPKGSSGFPAKRR